MSLESELVTALAGVSGGRIYPDTTPDEPTFPLIVYQQVGGKASEYVDQSLPDHDHARMQLVTWSKTRLEASTIARQAREAILAHDWPAQTYGAVTALHDDVLKLYGARQQFGIYYLP